DLRAEVEQKEAVVRQSQQELRLSRALVRLSAAAVDAAKATVAQKVAEAKQAAATPDFKLGYPDRVKAMKADRTITAEGVDESDRDHPAARAAYEAAQGPLQQAGAG